MSMRAMAREPRRRDPSGVLPERVDQAVEAEAEQRDEEDLRHQAHEDEPHRHVHPHRRSERFHPRSPLVLPLAAIYLWERRLPGVLTVSRGRSHPQAVGPYVRWPPGM